MPEISFKPLTDEERKRNQYLDKINHAPYFTIVLTGMAILLLLVTGALLGAF